jgi:hypothetical protein
LNRTRDNRKDKSIIWQGEGEEVASISHNFVWYNEEHMYGELEGYMAVKKRKKTAL